MKASLQASGALGAPRAPFYARRHASRLDAASRAFSMRQVYHRSAAAFRGHHAHERRPASGAISYAREMPSIRRYFEKTGFLDGAAAACLLRFRRYRYLPAVLRVDIPPCPPRFSRGVGGMPSSGRPRRHGVTLFPRRRRAFYLLTIAARRLGIRPSLHAADDAGQRR